MRISDVLRTLCPPTSREGIEKYLAGGLIKGIGPVYAPRQCSPPPPAAGVPFFRFFVRLSFCREC